MQKLAINGFGRIGRMVLRALVESGREDMQIVAINDLAAAPRLAHLLKYDSIHGRFAAEISSTDNSITVNGTDITVYNERDPEKLPWAALDIDVVLECTGFFLTKDLCGKHIMAGSKRVLMSAPAKDDTKTIVYGVNDNMIEASDTILSNASCTTNALAPLVSVLHKEYGIKSGIMTSIHAYTGDQPTHDSIHKDLNRGRAAAVSMVPTTTGAARTIGRVIPELDGKLNGVAVRVPVPNVSLVDLTVSSERSTSAEDVKERLRHASNTQFKGVMGYVDEKLVSADMNHDPKSTSVIADQIYVTDGTLIRVMAWYDNEWGFSNRMLDTVSAMTSFR